MPDSTNPSSQTPNQYSNYGQYTSDPTADQLATYFQLQPEDFNLIASCRHDHTRLGMAVQLCSLKFLSTFPTDVTRVPNTVFNTLKSQLGLDRVNLERYQRSTKTRFDHQDELCKHLGYTRFRGVAFIRVARLLLQKLFISNEPTNVLFDLVTAELVQHKVILPGSSTVARLIAKARERANVRLYRQVSQRLSRAQTQRLMALFEKPEAETRTRFERLRTPPLYSSSITIQGALERIEQLRALGVSNIKLDDLAENRLAPVLRRGLSVRAADLEKNSQARRVATLLILVQHLERSATDDALVVFDQVMQKLGLRGQRRRQQERLRTLKDLDAAALTLRNTLDQVALVLQDSSLSASKARSAALEQINASRLIEAKLRVADLASPAEDVEAEVWGNAHRSISPFLMVLLTTIKFEGGDSVKGLLEAIKFLKRTTGTARSNWGEIPSAFIPRTWRSLIFPAGRTVVDAAVNAAETTGTSAGDSTGDSGTFKRHHYLVCVAHQLHAAIKRGDIFVRDSNHHNDPRAQMLSGQAWQQTKPDVLRALGLLENPAKMISRWSRQLDATYKRVARALKDNPNLSLQTRDGLVVPVITPYEALPESPSLIALNANVISRLPEIALTELALEIDARVGFTQEMLLEAGSQAIGKDLRKSLIAVLIADSCNISLKSVSQADDPALTMARLDGVKRNYVHLDAIMRANAKLVEYHSRLALTQRWGGGEVASADGLRFVVPVKTIHAGPNQKYFGAKRGITYYTLVSDQFTMLDGQVIPGTMRDSLFILAALLEQVTHLRPREIMTDTGAYSDVIFGLFFLLGYKFSPRLRDAGGSKFWRINPNTNYGALNDLARGKISSTIISQHWEDVLRLISSLKLGKIKAVDVMRVLSRDSALNGLGKAVQEIGRIAKSQFLLEYISDEAFQRTIHNTLNHGETRHSMARDVAHGQKGEIRQHFRQGMENQLGALGFMLNVMVLWNTEYFQAALGMIEAMGDAVLEEDVARLSPLKWAHINLLGRYEFSMDPVVAGGDLRPLRDPNAFRGLEVES